jgi:hypothetical protein
MDIGTVWGHSRPSFTETTRYDACDLIDLWAAFFTKTVSRWIIHARNASASKE